MSYEEVGVPASIDDEIVALRAIVEGTSATYARFLSSPRRDTSHRPSACMDAFVAEFAGVATRVRTLANGGDGEIIVERRVRPCRNTVRGCGSRGPLSSPAWRPRAISSRSRSERQGDRELSGRPLARRRRKCLGAPGWVRRVGRCRPSHASSSYFGSSPHGLPSKAKRLRVEQRLVESACSLSRSLRSRHRMLTLRWGGDLPPDEREPPRCAASRLSYGRAGWLGHPWDTSRIQLRAGWEPNARFMSVSQGRRFRGSSGNEPAEGRPGWVSALDPADAGPGRKARSRHIPSAST